MAKGSNAKVEVTNKIAKAFGADYIGEVDKKLYVWANDGTERVQIAISMTCPKVLVSAADPTPAKGDLDFNDDGLTSAPSVTKKAEITPEETARIANLMEKLGL